MTESQIHVNKCRAGNKNRIEESEGGFAIKRKDGKRDYTLPVEASHIKVAPGEDEVPKKSSE